MKNISQSPARGPWATVAIVRVACSAVLLALLFWAWYTWAADYGYSAVSGTYVFSNNGQQSTLVLSANREFHQELTHSGTVQRSVGTWRRVGEGGVVFSKEFQQVADERVRADGQVDGQVEKSFGGFFVSIVLHGDKGELVFRRRLFR